jgi:hypothetical protein
MKSKRTVLGLQGLVSGYALIHHDEQESDTNETAKSEPNKHLPDIKSPAKK